MFCLGKVRQIQEAVAVESPCAEAEPVVVFRTSSLLTPTHWLLCRPSVLGYDWRKTEIHTGSNTLPSPSTTISSKTLSTPLFCLALQVCASFSVLELTGRHVLAQHVRQHQGAAALSHTLWLMSLKRKTQL